MVRIGLPEILIILIAMVVIFRFDAVAGRTRGFIKELKQFRKRKQEDPDKPDRQEPGGSAGPEEQNKPRV